MITIQSYDGENVLDITQEEAYDHITVNIINPANNKHTSCFHISSDELAELLEYYIHCQETCSFILERS